MLLPLQKKAYLQNVTSSSDVRNLDTSSQKLSLMGGNKISRFRLGQED